MRAASLFGVLLVARVLVLFDRDLPASPWAPIAFLWQDVGVVLAFALLDALGRPLRRPWIQWSAYGVAAVYVAVNVPITRTLSTPLTLSMTHAVRGALSDSILHHVSAVNILLIGLVLASAALFPLAVRRVSTLALVSSGLLGVPLLLLGPHATGRVDTGGLHRNAISALAGSLFPRTTETYGGAPRRDWRASPIDGAADVAGRRPLVELRGAARGRNVFLIVLESTGAEYLGIHGADPDPMPNLSMLARDSIVFETAYCVYPESVKTLMSTLCSIYPAFDVPARDYEAVRVPSIADVLGGIGYGTALFHSGRFMYLGMREVLRDRGFDVLEDAGDIGGVHESSFGVDEGSAVRRILEWIDGLPAERPFFVTYLPIAGHHPYDSPDGGPFPEEQEIGRYRNALRYGDEALGRLFEGLRERGLYEKSVFVVFGDHGQAFGQHEGNYGHSLFVYEENVRVPFLIAIPGLVDDTLADGRVSSTIDAAPTVLDLLGLEVPETFQGRSLLRRPASRMSLFFTDYSLGLLALRDGRWKCIHEIETGRVTLFDLENDPEERRDVSTLFPERSAAYRQHLRDWCAWQRNQILDRCNLAAGGR